MASLGDGAAGSLSTLAFETFWGWLLRHPNCIFRAGTPEVVLFDDDDLHWHFAADGPNYYVQVMRGKRLLGELLVEPERVSYVQELGEDREGEHHFELIAETESDRYVVYVFTLAHGYDGGEAGEGDRSHSVH